MRSKKKKGYWQKCRETFGDGAAARSRAGALRMHEHVAHVKVDKVADVYEVTYAVAKWYLESLGDAGVTL